MEPNQQNSFIVGPDDLILVTGATGFIGSKVVACLLDRGFRNLRCLARPSGKVKQLKELACGRGGVRVEVVTGNLLSRDDCAAAAKDVSVIIHLAAGRGEKSFPDAFLNSVVTTRNLLEATVRQRVLRRFVNISSFSVYSNERNPRPRVVDESSPLEGRPELRGSAYSFAKTKQDELVVEYATKFAIPYVIVRPGYVYGPGNLGITARVGIDTFGVFLHLGGGNRIPFTYVDNCADAIVLAGLTEGVDGEIFNVVDDDLPTSRQFLSMYKRQVKRFTSIYLPHFASYALCYVWEKYSGWSQNQLEPVFNRRLWRANWKKTWYSNEKLKARVGWAPKVPAAEAFRRYFQACKAGASRA